MRVQQLDEISLIFRAHASSRYSVAALVGALEIDNRLLDIDIDAPPRLSSKGIEKKIERGTVVLAYSVMSTQTKKVYEEIKSLRHQFGDNLKIIGGGAHASARPKELLANGFDFVVVGEGEKTFPDLLFVFYIQVLYLLLLCSHGLP